MSSEIVIAVLTAFGVGGAVSYLVKWLLFDRRASARDDTSTAIQNASTLSTTALDLATALNDQLETARGELSETKRAAEEARDEARAARREVDQMSARMNEVMDIVHREASWAITARDALLREKHWPVGLADRPPILTLVPR